MVLGFGGNLVGVLDRNDLDLWIIGFQISKYAPAIMESILGILQKFFSLNLHDFVQKEGRV